MGGRENLNSGNDRKYLETLFSQEEESAERKINKIMLFYIVPAFFLISSLVLFITTKDFSRIPVNNIYKDLVLFRGNDHFDDDICLICLDIG